MQQVAVVTGASSGIGWALCKLLAREGYAVGLTARRTERLEALRAEIEQHGGRAAVAAADAADRDDVIRAIRALADALGPVDLLIANAGVGESKPVFEPNAADYEAMVRINMLGPYFAIEAVLPSMIERQSGHLAVVSSLAASVTGPGTGQYSATKAGLSMWMEATRLELRDAGIYCTTLEPGFIRTPMTDNHDFHMPFLMDVDVAAARMLRAIHKRKKRYAFPWPLSWAVRLLARLPDGLRLRLMPGRAVPRPPLDSGS